MWIFRYDRLEIGAIEKMENLLRWEGWKWILEDNKEDSMELGLGLFLYYRSGTDLRKGVTKFGRISISLWNSLRILTNITNS